MSMPATKTHTNLADHTFTISRSQGYGLPSIDATVTLGSVLGTDHVAWIAEGKSPAATARGLSLDYADANLLDMAAAYSALSRILAS